MNKGQYSIGHKWVYFVVALFLLTFMFLFLRGMMVDYEVGRLSCVDDVIDEIIVAKLLYDEECFVYYDSDIGRQVPGTIDKSKFTQENYDNCFKFLDKKVNISIDDNTVGEQIFTPKTISKTILLYDEGTITPSMIQFTFASPTC